MNEFTTNEHELSTFFKDTADLAAAEQSKLLGHAAQAAGTVPSAQVAEALSNKVEFWKWMGRNWDCLASPELIAERANLGGGKTDWLATQAQGKGYEWDCFNKLRNDPRNILARMELGNDPTQPGIDMVKTDIFGNNTAYQNSKTRRYV